MMLLMRTTLTLDPDVAVRVRQEVRRTGKAFKAVINQALRRGLGMEPTRARAPRFRVKAYPLGVRPGIDLDRMNQLLDQLEVTEQARKLKRDSS